MNIAQPIIGGVLIGVAAFSLHILIGRIVGISGIVGRLLPPEAGESKWRLAFLGGLLAGGLVMALWDSSRFSISPGNPSYLLVVLAGLLVGFGTRLGSGCTSGHGVCGASRISLRSLVATVVFIAAGATTVAVRGTL